MATKKPKQYGWLDANLFIHPLFSHDPHGPQCRRILGEIVSGEAEGWLDPVTIHELTYALRVQKEKFKTNQDVVDYLLRFLPHDGFRLEDKDSVVLGLSLWVQGGTFGDARLRALASRTDLPICSVNGKDFPGVPNTYIADSK